MPFANTSLLNTPLVGLEELQRAAFYVFFEGVNNAIDQIQNYWISRDAEFDALTGRNTSPVALEHISSDNFHEGSKPSLVRGNPDLYPNISVFATQATPTPESDRYDQALDAWFVSLLVEVMVKGEDEEMTNRRIHRTAEAAILCLRRNMTLGGSITGLQTAPTIIISDLFAINSPSQGGAYSGQPNQIGSSPGGRYLWQGAQIQFRIPKDSVYPSSGSGTFADSSQRDYSKFIDQG